MKNILKVMLVLAAVLLLSAILSPFIYRLLPMFGFQKIFHRLVMLLAVAAALLFVKFTPKSLSERGFNFQVSWKRLLATGYVVGLVVVSALTVIEFFAGERFHRPFEWIRFADMFFSGLVGGLLIGIIEEFFFRGFIYVELEKKFGLFKALMMACAFYAIVHFFDPSKIVMREGVPTISESFRLLLWHLEPLVKRPLYVLPQFIGLFLFGMVLNLAFIRTRTLFLSIGIHASTVFVIKLQSAFLSKTDGDSYNLLWGGQALYDGSLEWLLLLILWLIVLNIPLPKSSSDHQLEKQTVK